MVQSNLTLVCSDSQTPGGGVCDCRAAREAPSRTFTLRGIYRLLEKIVPYIQHGCEPERATMNKRLRLIGFSLILLSLNSVAGAAAGADEDRWRGDIAAAIAATQRGDTATSLTFYSAAAKKAEAFPVADLRLATTLYGLARAHRAQYSYTQAEASFQRSLALFEAAGEPGRERMVKVLSDLGELSRVQGHYTDAEMYYKREIALIETTAGPDHPMVAHALSNDLASVYRLQWRRDEVESVYKRALAILEKAVPSTDSRLGLALIDLAEWYQSQRRYAEAEPFYRRGIPILRQWFPPAHARVLLGIQDWGLVTQMQGRYRDAEAVYKTMLSIIEKNYGAQHPNVGLALNNLVGLYEIQGRQADADALRKRMLEVGNIPFRTKPRTPYQGR